MADYSGVIFAVVGACVAFFGGPVEPAVGRDSATPEWVRHLALELPPRETLLAAKAKLEAAGVKVIGPKDGHMCVSIYFFDPNGHRLELTVRKIVPDERTERDAYRILDRWMPTKREVRDVEPERPI